MLTAFVLSCVVFFFHLVLYQYGTVILTRAAVRALACPVHLLVCSIILSCVLWANKVMMMMMMMMMK